jgi:hypothetical protein
MKRFFLIFKKKWFVITLVVLLSLYLVGIGLNLLTPPQPPPQPIGSFSEVIPGKTDIQALRNIGDIVDQKTDGDKTTYELKSEYQAYNHEAVVDKNNKIIFFKELTPVSGDGELFDEDKYGKEDLLLYSKEHSTGILAHVYLTKGKVFFVRINTKRIVEIWSFEPTDQETFLKSWGTTLTTEGDQPEEVPNPNSPP